MNENIKKALEMMFIYAGKSSDIPTKESYYKKKNWFLNHEWTEREEEKYKEWLSDYLKKNWDGITERKPFNKKEGDKYANEFVFQYGFKIRPVDIGEFTQLITDGQLKEVLSKRELKKWEEWSMGNTRSIHGIYRWDVEDFLKGLPNLD